MNAGDFDQPVTIQQPTASIVSPGQNVETWADMVRVWAKVKPFAAARGVIGREFFAAGAEQSDSAVIFTIRYRDDVTHRMRVVWKGKAHAIIGEPINVEGGDHTLELTCSAGVIPG